MSVKVEIPSIYSRYAGNHTSFEVDGKTVGEAIRHIGRDYPDLEKLILTGDGRPLNSISIFVNGELAYPDAPAWPVSDGDKIKVVILIQGG